MTKTFDDALDEFERWGEKLSKRLNKMTPKQRTAYLRDSVKRFEQRTGVSLKVQPPPGAEGWVRSLEQALEQIAQLQGCMVAALGRLPPEERRVFLNNKLQAFEKRTGIKLNLQATPAQRSARAM